MTRNARFFLGQNSKVSELCSGAVKEAAERMRETKFLVHVRVFAFFLRSRKWGENRLFPSEVHSDS
jgi:hypothetical protein